LQDRSKQDQKDRLVAELDLMREREAATREILEVISESRDDEQPVFDAILKRAGLLCQSQQAGLIMLKDSGTRVKYIASWGLPSKHFQVGISEWSIDDPIAITTAIRESRVVNIADLQTDSLTESRHQSRLEIVDKEGIRSLLAVPLISGGKAIGCIDVYRQEFDPYSNDEVQLLQSFAIQAVIAIENVRQFREVQTRLE
jgi:GAF domain-containing protein